MDEDTKAIAMTIAWTLAYLTAAIAGKGLIAILILFSPILVWLISKASHSITERGVVKTALAPINALSKSVGGKKVVEIAVTISGNKPKVIFPSKMWNDHCKMVELIGRREFATLLEIEEKDGVFKVVDWFLPYQEAGPASVKFPINETMPDFLRQHGKDGIDNWYGVLHLHPWSGKTVGMSGIDVGQMWDWVKPVGRGVYIVMNKSRAVEAIFVTQAGGIAMQIPMDFEIEYPPLELADSPELKKMMDEKIKAYVWTGWRGGKKTYMAKEIITPYACPHCGKDCDTKWAHKCVHCDERIEYRDIPKIEVEKAYGHGYSGYMM
jgi:hypothetical protein